MSWQGSERAVPQVPKLPAATFTKVTVGGFLVNRSRRYVPESSGSAEMAMAFTMRRSEGSSDAHLQRCSVCTMQTLNHDSHLRASVSELEMPMWSLCNLAVFGSENCLTIVKVEASRALSSLICYSSPDCLSNVLKRSGILSVASRTWRDVD